MSYRGTIWLRTEVGLHVLQNVYQSVDPQIIMQVSSILTVLLT